MASPVKNLLVASDPWNASRNILTGTGTGTGTTVVNVDTDQGVAARLLEAATDHDPLNEDLYRAAMRVLPAR